MDRQDAVLKNPEGIEQGDTGKPANQRSPIILDSDGELQDMVFCVFCGKKNNSAAQKCRECGLSLDESSLESLKLCYVCGHPNEAGDVLCSDCGAPLSEVALKRRSQDRRILIQRVSSYSNYIYDDWYPRRRNQERLLSTRAKVFVIVFISMPIWLLLLSLLVRLIK